MNDSSNKPSFFKKHRKSVAFSTVLALLGIFTAIIFPPAKLITWGLFIQNAINITPLVTQGAIGAGVGLTSGIALSWLGNREAIRTLWQNHWKLITFTSALMLTAILVSLLCPPAFLVGFMGTLKGIGLSTLYAKVVICNIAAVVAGITGGFLSWVASKLSQLNAFLVLISYWKKYQRPIINILQPLQDHNLNISDKTDKISNPPFQNREKLEAAVQHISKELQCSEQAAAEILNNIGKGMASNNKDKVVLSNINEIVLALLQNKTINPDDGERIQKAIEIKANAAEAASLKGAQRYVHDSYKKMSNQLKTAEGSMVTTTASSPTSNENVDSTNTKTTRRKKRRANNNEHFATDTPNLSK